MARVLAMQNEGANDERATPGRAQPVARAFFHNQPLDHEFDAELAVHLELAIEANLWRDLSLW